MNVSRSSLLSLLLPIALSGCGEKSHGPTQLITLGAVIDGTGINSEPSWADAIQLAERHANAGLRESGTTQGLGGLGFRVAFADSANEPALAVVRAQKLVREEGARALILDTSQVDQEILKTYYDADPSNDLNVPLQCGSCTSGTINNPTATAANDPVAEKALRNPDRWNWRSIMSTRLISQVLVELMLRDNNGDANGDGKFKIAYLGSDEVFGRGSVRDLKAFAIKLHPTPPPIFEELYHPRDAVPNSYDWAGAVAKLVDNQTEGQVDGAPDAVLVANFAEQQAAFVRAYRQSKSGTRLLHYHTLRISSAMQSLGALADGAEGVSHVLVDAGASGDRFAADFKERYGTSVVYRDAIYYDNAMTLMLAALIAAQPLADPTAVTGEMIRSALPRTSVPGAEVIQPGEAGFARAAQLIAKGQPINYEGASGPMDYDDFGNVVQRLARYRAEKGLFQDVAKYDCVRAESCPQIQ
jgi:branched-chain amino acid transport system substrate-binding protein